MAKGRTPQARSIASVATTSGSANLTAPAGSFSKNDVGRKITGTGIPAGATLSAVASDTAATLSANATASGTITAQVLGDVAGAYGFAGWSPETDAEADTYSVAAVNAGKVSPDRITDTVTYAGAKRRTRT